MPQAKQQTRTSPSFRSPQSSLPDSQISPNLNLFCPLPSWTPTAMRTLKVYYFGSAKAQHLSLGLGDPWSK